MSHHDEAGGTVEKPRVKAEDNPWYWLATLHGAPDPSDTELQNRNRIAWNRCMASWLTDEERDRLAKTNRHPTEELTPLSEDEWKEVEAAFQVRSKNRIDCIAELARTQIDFSRTEFEYLPFAGRIFPGKDGIADFHGATFSGIATFAGATFGVATFDGATFGVADFGGATFSSIAVFDRATFYAGSFEGATFSGLAGFQGAMFSDVADFSGAMFSGRARFDVATFYGSVDFDGAAFSRSAHFDGTVFTRAARFINVEMKAPTSFEKARFLAPPQFFGAKLHEGTVWRNAVWPKRPDDAEQAGPFVDSYERLKLEMDRLKKFEDELVFFARELQCRRVLIGFWRGLPLALYGGLCGYGRYYMRPLAILVVIVILGAVPIRAHFGGGWSLATFTDHGFGGGATGLSFANTFGILGIRKDLIDPEILQNLPGWLKVIATIQTVLGIVLLFLFGLAIRNRFRMK